MLFLVNEFIQVEFAFDFFSLLCPTHPLADIDINEMGKATWVNNVPRADIGAPTSSGIDFDPTVDDPQWPGEYTTIAPGITINIRYDEYPEETSWTWQNLTDLTNDGTSQVVSKSETSIWKKMDSNRATGEANDLKSFNQVVDSGLYRLVIEDSSNDGNCCSWGRGFFTITNATSVVWSLAGNEFSSNMDAYIWVDEKLESQAVKRIPGVGYGLAEEREDEEGPTSLYFTSGSATVKLVVIDSDA